MKAASCGPAADDPKSGIEEPKSDRVAAFVGTLALEGRAGLDPRYLGYFALFNQARYYEAHDVLEHLWLECRDENRLFYKALIQVAGAFVHLQKQRARPAHPTDGRRLRPAERLLRLAVSNLSAYRPERIHLDVSALCMECERLAAQIARGDYERNPWRPESAQRIDLIPESAGGAG